MASGVRRSATRVGAVALALLLASACATLPRGDLVFIDVGGDKDCVIDVEGRHFALPQTEAGLDRHLRRLAKGAGGALMGPRPARTSPGCWDAAMRLALNAGFARIGYLSETPLPQGIVG